MPKSMQSDAFSIHKSTKIPKKESNMILTQNTQNIQTFGKSGANVDERPSNIINTSSCDKGVNVNLFFENPQDLSNEIILNNLKTKLEFLQNDILDTENNFSSRNALVDSEISNITRSIQNNLETMTNINNEHIKEIQNNLSASFFNDLSLVNFKIKAVDENLKTRLESKADKALTDIKIDNTRSESNIKINNNYTSLFNILTDMKNDIMSQETKLSYLLLNRDDLINKLNIISEISNLGTDENLNIINSVNNLAKKTSDQVLTLTTYFEKLNIDVANKLKNINELISINEQGLIDELTARKLDVKTINEYVAQVELNINNAIVNLNNEVQHFSELFNKKDVELQQTFDEVYSLINKNYTKIYNFVQKESKERVLSNNRLEIKITEVTNTFMKEVQKIDYSKDITDLDSKINKNTSDIITVNNNIADQITDIIGTIQLNKKQADLIKETVLAKIDNSEDALNIKIQNVLKETEKVQSSTNESLNAIKQDIETLKNKISIVDSNDSNTSDNSGASTISIPQITELQKTVLENTTSIQETLVDITQTKADLIALVTSKNNQVFNIAEDALIKAKSAIFGIDSVEQQLTIRLNNLKDTINTIVGNVPVSDINLETVNKDVQDKYYEIKKVIENYKNDQKILYDALELRVTVLENEFQKIKISTKESDAKNELDIQNLSNLTDTRIKDLNTKITDVENMTTENTSNIDFINNSLNLINTTIETTRENVIEKAETELKNLQNTLNTKINGNTVLINEVKNTFDNVQNSLNSSINAEVEARSAAIANLDNKLVSEIDERKAQAQSLLDSLNEEKEKLNNVLSGSTEAFDSLKEILDYVNKLSGEKETMFTDLVKTVNNIKTTLQDELNTETLNRETADENLQESINTEVNNRLESIKTVTDLINKEVQDRVASISEVDNTINELKVEFNNKLSVVDNTIINLTQVVADNLQADIDRNNITNKKIDDAISTLNEAREKAVLELNNTISEIDTKLTDLKNANDIAHASMLEKINNNTSILDVFFGTYPKESNRLEDIYKKITDLDTVLEGKISASIKKASDDNKVLESNIKETTDALNNSLTQTKADLAQEKTDRSTEDKKLSNSINELNTKVDSNNTNTNARIDEEVVIRKTKDDELRHDLNVEITTRTEELNNTNKNVSDLTKVVEDNDKNINDKVDKLAAKEDADNKNIIKALSDESQIRTNNDSKLETLITDEINRSTSKDIEIEALATKNENDIRKIMQDSDASLDSFKEVKDALNNIDAKYTSRTNEIEADYKLQDSKLDAKISTEIEDRITDTSVIKETLNTEISDRKKSVADLTKVVHDNKISQDAFNSKITTDLNTEKQERINADKNLSDNLATETSIRQTKDQELRNDLNKETQDRISAVGNLTTRVQKNENDINSFEAGLSQEKTDRQTEDQKLENEIEKLQETINNIFDGSTQDLDSFKEIVDFIKSTDMTNDNNLIAFSKTVYNSIEELHSNISAEASARAGNDNIIMTKLNSEIQERVSQLQAIAQSFANNKVQVQKINSDFKNDILDTITSFEQDTNNIIKKFNNNFAQIKNLIELVNTDLEKETQDRIFYINQLQSDLDTLTQATDDKYSIAQSDLLNAIHKFEIEIADIKTEVSNNNTDLNTRIDLNVTNIQNTNNNLKAIESNANGLIKTEENTRISEDKNLKNDIDLLTKKVDNNNTNTSSQIKNLDDKVNSILNGSTVDPEEFQKIVDVLNSIDTESDIIRNLKDDINFKIADVNAHHDRDKQEIIESIVNIKAVALGLVTAQTETYNNRFLDLKNRLLAKIENNTDSNKIELDALSLKLGNEIRNRESFYNNITSYLDQKLQAEKTLRVSSDNNINQKLAKEIENRKSELLSLSTILTDKVLVLKTDLNNRIDTVQHAINSEITNRTLTTNTLENTVNDFINTNSNLISEFTSGIDDKVLAISQTVGNGVNDYINLSDAVKDSLTRLDDIQQKVYAQLKNDLENGNIDIANLAGGNGSNGGNGGNGGNASLSDLDLQSLLNTIDSRIQNVVVQESKRAQTKELNLEAKIIEAESTAKLDNDQNKELLENLGKDIKTAVDTKIDNLENLLNTLTQKEKDLNNTLTDEIQDRITQYGRLNSFVAKNTDGLSNTKTKLDEYIQKLNKNNSEIISIVDNNIDSKMSVISQEFTNLANDLTSKTKVIDTKVTDFQNMLLALNNKEAELSTGLSHIQEVINDLFKDSTVDLDSLKEVVDYIKLHDQDIIQIQNNIIKGSGLDNLGEYVVLLNSHYLDNTTSLYQSIDKLDEVIYQNDNDRKADILKLTNDLNAEIAARIEDIKNVKNLIEQVRVQLQDQITENASNISSNRTDIDKNQIDIANEIQDRKLNESQIRASVGLEDDNSLKIDNTHYINSNSVKNDLIDLDTSLYDNTKNLQTQIGNLDNLATQEKDDLVSAINELDYKIKHPIYGNTKQFDDAFILQNL